MKDYLVIVESPHKAKTISRYLGKDYLVDASVGHITELEIGNKKYPLGVIIDNDFEPLFVVSKDKEKVIKRLKKEVSEVKEVYLATDPDREGEAISFHLAEELGLDPKTTKRLEFHEVTYNAIKTALANPRTIDMNLVASQETRRVLDRLMGFSLSPLLQRKISAPSAGRVQSVVLKLIVERQREIEAFKEEVYYLIKGVINVDDNPVNVNVTLNNEEVHFKTEEEAKNAIEAIKSSKIKLIDVKTEEKQRASKPVYTTSTMQQDAANILKFNSKKTMKTAQSLYEGIDLGEGEVGLITYMRTDSVRITPAFINKTKELISKKHGEDYVGTAKVFNKNTDNVQDAHEGIRPTDLAITPDMLKGKASEDEEKLYRLIYTRTVASIMKNEVYNSTTAKFEANEFVLVAKGEERLFAGFTKELADLDKIERVPLPCEINENSKIKAKSFKTKESKTKGPVGYSEASIIQQMEKDGIGRPSTYAQTLDNLKTRKYVEIEKGYYKPTAVGVLANDKLQEYFADFIKVDYTANMEADLDKIAMNELTRSEALTDFYKNFTRALDIAKKEMVKESVPLEDLGECPMCGKPLVKRQSRFGSFVACSGYPNCKYIKQDALANRPCPKCSEGKILLKTSKFGKFYACSNYPNCDYTEKYKK